VYDCTTQRSSTTRRSWTKLIILMIRLKASMISNKDLIGCSGWQGMRTRDILQRGRLRLSDKLPLDNRMTRDETQAAYMLIISLRSRRQRKLSICLEE
jgi:hypothetical protein